MSSGTGAPTPRIAHPNARQLYDVAHLLGFYRHGRADSGEALERQTDDDNVCFGWKADATVLPLASSMMHRFEGLSGR